MRERLTQVLAEVKPKLGVDEIVVRELGHRNIAREVYSPELSPQGISTYPYLYFNNLVPRVYTLNIEDSATTFYTDDELKGYIASELCELKSEAAGYGKTIRTAMRGHSSRPWIPFTLADAFERFSAEQIAIEDGFRAQLYAFRSRQITESRNLLKEYIKRNARSVFVADSESIENLINFVASPSFYASGNTHYGRNLDELSKELLALMSIDNRILLKYDEFRKFLTIKNPPTQDSVRKHVNGFLKLLSDSTENQAVN